jgi:hypothetical protein
MSAGSIDCFSPLHSYPSTFTHSSPAAATAALDNPAMASAPIAAPHINRASFIATSLLSLSRCVCRACRAKFQNAGLLYAFIEW